MLYSVVLVSTVPQSESDTCTRVSFPFDFPSRLGQHRALSRAPSAVQWALFSCLFHALVSIVCMLHAALLPSCLTHSDPMDCSLPGSHGLQPARLLCPGDSPGKNTGVGCHFLLQGIFQCTHVNPDLPVHPPLPPPLVSMCLFSLSVSIFLLCK